MNRFYKLTALLTWVLAITVTGNAFSDGEWLRAGPVWFKGLVYAGTSKVALTNAAGNLASTTGAFSGAVSTGALTSTTGVFSSTLNVVGAVSVTGATTLRDAVTVADELLLTDVEANVTASVGSAQGSGATTATIVRVGTSGTNGDSVTLPGAQAGLCLVVGNSAAANNIDVFPAASDAINKETANTAITLAAGETMFCCAVDAIQWICVIGSAT